jgi:hypothetical protein
MQTYTYTHTCRQTDRQAVTKIAGIRFVKTDIFVKTEEVKNKFLEKWVKTDKDKVQRQKRRHKQ